MTEKNDKIKIAVRRFLIICTAVLFIFAVASCNIIQTPLDTGKQSDKKRDISLDVWVFFDENTPGTYYVDYWKELSEKYGYRINVKTYSTEQLKDKLEVSLVCKELPDIFAVWGGSYPDFLFDAGACIPVQDYIKKSGLHFKQSYVRPYKDGNNYIIPCLVEAYGVTYCNTSLMSQMGLEMPKSWDELVGFVKQVEKYNREHHTDYAAIELGDKDNWLGELLYTTIVNRIDPYAQERLADGTAVPTDSVYAQAAEKLCMLRNMGAFPDNYLETGEVEAIENFVEGKALLFPHQSTIVYYLMERMGSDAFSVEQFPCCADTWDPDYDSYIMDINHTQMPGLCISSDTKYADEAAKLCLDFAQEVNERNVTEYGYLDIMEESGLKCPKELPEPVKQFRAMIRNAKKYTPLWYAVLDKEDGDNWRNLTKRLFGGTVTVSEFTKEAEQYLQFQQY